jgi:hypothetical protein
MDSTMSSHGRRLSPCGVLFIGAVLLAFISFAITSQRALSHASTKSLSDYPCGSQGDDRKLKM